PAGRRRLLLVALRAHDRGVLPPTRRRKARAVTHALPLAAAYASLALACASTAQDAPPAPPTSPALPARPDAGASAENVALATEMTPEMHEAVDRGLAWLASQQNPDGSWDSGRWRGNVGIISLACLAFMADGNLPGRGPYG